LRKRFLGINILALISASGVVLHEFPERSTTVDWRPWHSWRIVTVGGSAAKVAQARLVVGNAMLQSLFLECKPQSFAWR